MEQTQPNNLELKAEKTALVVIDLQKGIAAIGAYAAPHTGEKVVENAGKMAKAFAEKGAFIVLVRVSTTDGKDMLKPLTDAQAGGRTYSAGWDEIVSELADIPGTHLVTKHQWGAFHGTDLDLQLRRRGIDTIVLCGISTAIGVDMTAREAFQHGYQQVFAEDAMTAQTAEEHNYVVKHIFPRIGRIRSSEDVVAALK